MQNNGGVQVWHRDGRGRQFNLYESAAIPITLRDLLGHQPHSRQPDTRIFVRDSDISKRKVKALELVLKEQQE